MSQYVSTVTFVKVPPDGSNLSLTSPPVPGGLDPTLYPNGGYWVAYGIASVVFPSGTVAILWVFKAS